MLEINFVTEAENRKWVLRRWCEEWAKYIPEATIGTAPSSSVRVDVNIYCNYAILGQVVHPTNTKCVAIFTHREKEDATLQVIFDQAAERADWCFAQSNITAKYLPLKKTSILRPSIGAQFFNARRLRIGVVGRNYPSGRKNFDWVAKLSAKFPKIRFLQASGEFEYDQMHHFYNQIDYLLITANNEGGPMPVLEALAMHKPVIAPVKVGWCDEFTTIKYDGSFENLVTTIDGLIIPKDGWEIGAKQIVDVCERLCYGNNKTIY